jgi:hypothetical protein
MKIRADEATAMLQAQVSREELTLTQRHQQEMAALQANHAQEQLAQTHIQDQQAAASEMAHEMSEAMAPGSDDDMLEQM